MDGFDLVSGFDLRRLTELGISSSADVIVQALYKSEPDKYISMYSTFDDGFTY